MRSILLPLPYILCLFFSFTSSGQDGITVSGKDLYDYCGQKIILRGVNYPVLDDWDFPQSSEVSAQIALTGANSVRVAWYMNYGQPSRPAYGLRDLDTVLTRLARLKMVPILEIHDLTCKPGFGELNSVLLPWFTQPPVLAIIQKHKRYLILNLANEYGFVRWAANPTIARTNFRNTYSALVSGLRNAGIHVPIMIDAPDCGTTLSTLISVGQTMQQSDPDHNLIFSVHTYWFGYTTNDSVAIRNELITAKNAIIPIVLGEVATQQDDQTPCQYNLNYKAILRLAREFDLGWLIWSWYKDVCPSRKMSSNGSFNGLTPLGSEIIHDPDFGFQGHSIRSKYLLENGICASSTSDLVTKPFLVFPNPVKDWITIPLDLNPQEMVCVYSMLGQLILKTELVENRVYLGNLPPSLYRISVKGKSGVFIKN